MKFAITSTEFNGFVKGNKIGASVQVCRCNVAGLSSNISTDASDTLKDSVH